MVKVLFIMGWGRSGTTLLDNLLGHMDGFFSVGELHYLWERGLVERGLCGCGKPVVDCQVWSAVLAKALSPEERGSIPAEAVARWKARSVRVRQTWRLLLLRDGARNGQLRAYLDLARRLYAAIAEVTGARVVVESSKRPSDAAILRMIDDVAPVFVHLVRDPRAVAFSWSRRGMPTDTDPGREMSRHGAAASTLYWTVWNAAAEAVRRRSPAHQSLLLRYEDLVADPAGSISTVMAAAGEPPQTIPGLSERRVLIGVNHTVSGNPSRFRTGPVDLTEDVEWVASQPPVDRVVSTVLALPFLHRYGYRIVPSDLTRSRSRAPQRHR